MITKTSLNKTGDVYVQDQDTPIIDLLFFRDDGQFSLDSDAVVGESSFTASAGHGIVEDDIVCFQEGSKFMQATVLSVVSDEIEIDSPFDYAFTTTGGCSHGSCDMAVNGSSTPVVFRIGPGNLDDGIKWDITRVIEVIIDDDSMDDGKFGGVTALTRGRLLRKKDGDYKNLFNAKTNGDFKLRNLDGVYVDATQGPSGNYSFSTRRTFSGQEKNGVVVRLEASRDDELQIIIQDDLTGLESYKATAQGHVVE